MALKGNRQVQAACREIIRQYEEFFNAIIAEEEKNIRGGKINSDSSFGYAKEAIRRESMIEGMKRVIQLIHKYAKEEE